MFECLIGLNERAQGPIVALGNFLDRECVYSVNCPRQVCVCRFVVVYTIYYLLGVHDLQTTSSTQSYFLIGGIFPGVS